jgi:tetratricopeptide (TPR) repeat protein
LQSQVTDSTETNKISSARKKRLLVLGLILLGIVVSAPFWGQGLWIDFCQQRAEQNLLAREPERALEWITSAARFDESNPRTALLKARALRKAHDVEGAYAALKSYYELEGATPAFQQEQWLLKAQVGDNSDLQAHLSEILIEPEGSVQDICETYVNSCILNYQFDDALQILKLWEADFPTDPLPNFMRGKMYEHNLAWEAASTEYEAALSKDPGFAPAAYSLGRIQLTLKKTEAALEYFQRAVQNTDQPWPAQVGVARCLRLLNRNAESKALLEQVLQEDPEKLQKSYQALGDHKVLALSSPQQEMAKLELAEKNYEVALKWLEPAARANPLDLGIKNSLVQVYSRLGRKEEAKELGQLIKETNQVLAEIPNLLERVQANPGDVELRFEIGSKYLKYVSEEQGVVWLNSVLQYQPDHWGAHQALANYYEQNLSRGASFERLAKLHRERAQALAAQQNQVTPLSRDENSEKTETPEQPVESSQP